RKRLSNHPRNVLSHSGSRFSAESCPNAGQAALGAIERAAPGHGLGNLQVEYNRPVVGGPEVQRAGEGAAEAMCQASVETKRDDVTTEMGDLARANVGEARDQDRADGIVVADNRRRPA